MCQVKGIEFSFHILNILFHYFVLFEIESKIQNDVSIGEILQRKISHKKFNFMFNKKEGNLLKVDSVEFENKFEILIN